MSCCPSSVPRIAHACWMKTVKKSVLVAGLAADLTDRIRKAVKDAQLAALNATNISISRKCERAGLM